MDLFNRVPLKEHPLVKVARFVGILAAFMFIHTVVAPIGACYHGYWSLKHAVLWIVGIGDGLLHKEKFNKHARSSQIDCVYSIPFLVGYFFLQTPERNLWAGAYGATIAYLAIFSVGLMDPRFMACMPMDQKDRYGFSKSFMLRDLCGIVDQETGGLLSWDSSKDHDVELPGNGSYQLKGYFANLYYEQSLACLEEIQMLQATLPPSCKMPSFYPPWPMTIIDFLNKNRASSGLSDVEIKGWEKKFLAIKDRIQLLWEIMSKCFDVSVWGTKNKHYRLKMSFPVPETICRSYVQTELSAVIPKFFRKKDGQGEIL